MFDRLLVISLALSLAACPADGPIAGDDADGGSSNADAESEPDGGDEDGLALASLEPTEGPAAGGTEVTLSGDGFVEGMTVRFGSSAAVDATIASPTEATVTTPSSTTAGAVAVVVRNPDGETDSLLNGFRYVGDVEVPEVDYCQLQAQSPVSATAGVATEGIYAIVFVEGVTNTEGQGSGIEGELGWGADDSHEEFDFVPMTYNLDADGLNPGDIANDEYGASLTIPMVGSFRYVARFRMAGTDAWTYCDLDGSDNGVSADQLGVVEVSDPVPDACNLQFPQLVEDGEVGTAISFFGRVTKAGVTGLGSAGAVTGELLVGPIGMDPRPDATGFEVVSATYNADPIGLGPEEDEYTASYTPTAAGEVSFAFRFSVDDGATWSFCGLDDPDATDRFDPETMGWLAVTDGTPDVIDFCHVWQDTLDDDLDPNNLPVVTVEVFEAGLTDSGGDPADIEAEVTFAPLATNPAIASLPWQPMPYKGPRPGVPQNYEYEGSPYTPALHPDAGMYNVVARVREAGSTLWTYCDTDETASEFRLDAATRLTVSP